MDSITKITLNKLQIVKLVKKAFGEEAQIKSFDEIKDGWFNTIYSILLDDMREVILKIAPSEKVKILRYEKNIMKTEVEVLKLLKEKGKVPVPAVYFHDNTGTDLENEYFFMEKISGQAYNKIRESLSEDEKNIIVTELGMYNRFINDIKGDMFGYFSQLDKATVKWFDAFHIMLGDILQDGKEYDVKLPLEYCEIDELISSKSYAFDSVIEPRLVHWDLHDGNVIIGNDGHIAGIIDCDRAIWGDPLIEVYFGDFFSSTEFIKGYGIIPMSDKNAKCKRILYNIYLYIIMVVESYYRGYDDNHKNWTYKLLDNEIKKLLTL